MDNKINYPNLTPLAEKVVPKDIPLLLKTVPFLGSLALGSVIATKVLDPPTEKIIKKKREKIDSKLIKAYESIFSIGSRLPLQRTVFMNYKQKIHPKIINYKKEIPDEEKDTISENLKKILKPLKHPVRDVVKYFKKNPKEAAKALALSAGGSTAAMVGWGAFDSANRIRGYEDEYLTALKRAHHQLDKDQEKLKSPKSPIAGKD